MELFFWITYCGVIFLHLLEIILKFDILNYRNFIIVGVYFPISLYFLRWSEFMEEKSSNDFYYIFSLLNIFMIIFNILERKLYIKKIRIKDYKIKNANLLKGLNLFYLLMLIIENFILSGTLFPMLNGIDIHTDVMSAGLAIIITKNTLPINFINFLFFNKTKNKKYLFYIFILICFPMITRGARHTAIQEGIMIVLFALFLLKKDFIKLIKNNFLKIIFIVFIALSITEYRTYTTNKIKIDIGTYSDWIKYKGPYSEFKIIPNYYGYYPMSFDNLDRSIKENSEKFEGSYFGQNTFRGIYSGIHKIIFKYTPYENGKYRVYSSTAATVPTGFYDFYYDYKNKIYIPFFIIFMGCHFLLKKCIKIKKIKWIGIYIICVYGWLDMAFLNSLFRDQIGFSLLFYMVYIKIFTNTTKDFLYEK